MTHYRPQARRTARIPLWPVTLALMLASAALVVAVLWLGLSVLFSMGAYVEQVIP